jgi:polar amino acid transport system substrate-binding protein
MFEEKISMLKHKHYTKHYKKMVAMVLLAMLALTFMPASAAGPVYPDLPDLGGQEIVIAVENLYTPFQFENPSTGETMGYEYDMMAEICKRINCTPTYEYISWDAMITSVSEGQFDIGMTGITILDERKQQVDFSDPYINLQQFLLARSDEDRFANVDDFVANEDLKVGVQQGTSGYWDMLNYLPEDSPRMVVYTEFGALVQALIIGDVDAVPVDAASARGFISTTGGAVKVVGDPISEEEMGLIFPKGGDLVAPMNAAIASMKQDGFLDFLMTKWFFNYEPSTGELYAGMPDLGGEEIVIAVENGGFLLGQPRSRGLFRIRGEKSSPPSWIHREKKGQKTERGYATFPRPAKELKSRQ